MVVVLGVLVVVTMPLVVRQLALDRLEDVTSREAWIADVDLNLFTRRLVLKEVSVRC